MSAHKLIRLASGFVAATAIWSGILIFTERTRTIEGTWVDLFEGSRFFEDQSIGEACGHHFMHAPSFPYTPTKGSAAEIIRNKNWNSGQFISANFGPYPVSAYKMKFIGHKNVSQAFGLTWILGFGYGHMADKGYSVLAYRDKMPVSASDSLIRDFDAR